MSCLRSLGRCTALDTMKCQFISYCSWNYILPHSLSFVGKGTWIQTFEYSQITSGPPSMTCQHVLHHQTSLFNIFWYNFQRVWSPISWSEGFSVSIPNNTWLHQGPQRLGNTGWSYFLLKGFKEGMRTLFNSIFCFSVKLPSLCLRSFRITRCKDPLN